MIQIDMSMPKCCADCCFASADLVGPVITLSCTTPTGRQMYAPDLITRKDRPEWCPLKEWEEHWIGKSLGANVYQLGNDLYFKEIDKGASYRIINKLIGGVIESVEGEQA